MLILFYFLCNYQLSMQMFLFFNSHFAFFLFTTFDKIQTVILLNAYYLMHSYFVHLKHIHA